MQTHCLRDDENITEDDDSVEVGISRQRLQRHLKYSDAFLRSSILALRGGDLVKATLRNLHERLVQKTETKRKSADQRSQIPSSDVHI